MANKPENSGRKQERDTRFKPGQSGNPAGKPPGAKNKTTLLAQKLLDGEAEELIRKIIERAKDGDMQALKVCVDRLCPPLKPQSTAVTVDLNNTKSLAEIARAFIDAAADGSIAPDIASLLVGSVGTLARVKEVDELKTRMAALESAVGKR